MALILSSSLKQFFLSSTLLCTVLALSHAEAQVVKLYDFPSAPASLDDPSWSNYVRAVSDGPLILGEGDQMTLWFTSASGGWNGGGTLASFMPSTRDLKQVINNLGGNFGLEQGFQQRPSSPDATPIYHSGNGSQNYLYFTTTSGGVSGAGTLVRYDMDRFDPATGTGEYEVLWEATAGYPQGRSPRGTVAVIDSPNGGQDVYFTTTLGGLAPETSAGTLLKYNTNSGLTSVLHDFSGSSSNIDGRAPYDGFVQVGDKLYFTNFMGGGPGTGPAATGGGSLGAWDMTTETYSTLAPILGTANNGPGSEGRLPASTPVYDPVRNSLFFTTVGGASTSGSIQKYDLATGNLEVVWSSADNSIFGSQNYASPFVYGDDIYIYTRGAGENGKGAISRYNLVTDIMELVYSFESGGSGNNNGDFAYSDYAFNPDGSWYYAPSLYFMTSVGGDNLHGGIYRLELPALSQVPEPSKMILMLMAGSMVAFRRQR